jgi:hypothetical protein
MRQAAYLEGCHRASYRNHLSEFRPLVDHNSRYDAANIDKYIYFRANISIMRRYIEGKPCVSYAWADANGQQGYARFSSNYHLKDDSLWGSWFASTLGSRHS